MRNMASEDSSHPSQCEPNDDENSPVSISEPSKTQNAFRRASAIFRFRSNHEDPKEATKKYGERVKDEDLSQLLSCLYCQSLVLIGLVLPLSEVLIDDISPLISQGFYIFLCSGSLVYLTCMYAGMVKDRTVINIINSYRGDANAYEAMLKRFRGPINRYGSFYLRLGAIAFGIGSMVYSGLEFGQILELHENPDCDSITKAPTPIFRLILTMAQMQFIFLNNQNMDLCHQPNASRIGLMHLIATNLCEWLNVIIQESKHDIEHFRHHHGNESHDFLSKMNGSSFNCRNSEIIGPIIHQVSPFLFPCTIEYSLICAVIILDMWMDVKALPKRPLAPSGSLILNTVPQRSNHVLTVDFANAHKGLFSGVFFLVLTIVCLIIHFVFTDEPGYQEDALLVIECCDIINFSVAFLVVIVASMKLLKFSKGSHKPALSMDTCLLLLGQFGVSMFSTFRLTGLLITSPSSRAVWVESIHLLQSLCQTIFIVHGRTLVVQTKKARPGRQLITFLLPCNMAIWAVLTLVKNRSSYDMALLELFGPWAWTTVTRIAMPLAIFYRFHSTICLLEIWKYAYKQPHGSRHG